MTEVDIRSLRDGDEKAFRAIVREYNGMLLWLALIYTPNREVAEEIVQETWLSVLQGLDGFEERSSLRTWICRILINTARRRASIESRSTPVAMIDEENDGPAVPSGSFVAGGPVRGRWDARRDDWSRLPEDRLLTRELRQVVSEAVVALPARQREVMTLRDIHGWNSAEVRDLLDISSSHQRVLLHRARGRVRQALEDYLESNQSPEAA